MSVPRISEMSQLMSRPPEKREFIIAAIVDIAKDKVMLSNHSEKEPRAESITELKTHFKVSIFKMILSSSLTVT